jgi:hypothetical protein
MQNTRTPQEESSAANVEPHSKHVKIGSLELQITWSSLEDLEAL